MPGIVCTIRKCPIAFQPHHVARKIEVGWQKKSRFLCMVRKYKRERVMVVVIITWNSPVENILDYIIRAATSRRSGGVGSTTPLVSTPGRVAKAMSFRPLFQQVELQFEFHLKLFDYWTMVKPNLHSMCP